MAVVLDFEKPIVEIQKKIDELKKMSEASGMDLDNQIQTFEQQAQDYKKELYSKLKPSQKLQIARHPERPKFLDYVDLICEDFIELHGDREGMDDRAIIGGIAKLNGKPVMIIGIQKGKSTKENLEYNFGMPQPQGYRKALRLFKHANKFKMPIGTSLHIRLVGQSKTKFSTFHQLCISNKIYIYRLSVQFYFCDIDILLRIVGKDGQSLSICQVDNRFLK